MLLHDGISAMEPAGYCGKILHLEFSSALKGKVVEVIDAFRAVDATGAPVITYISAWREADKIIWYEYVSQGLCELLQCRPEEVAEVFRQSVIDRREYKYTAFNAEILEEVITRQELQANRQGLRDAVKKKGGVEAIYKVVIQDRKAVWLKDRAVTKVFAEDGVFVSFGSLTDVTKEMAQKDLLQKIGYFDELTRLPKRNIMQMLLEMSFGQLQKKLITNFSFLMIKVDDFEAIVTRHGQEAGDSVLEGLAELFSAGKRREDEVGRYGGDEFYALTHGGLTSGRELAERLRRTVEKTRFSWAGETIGFTVSTGVVEATELAKLNIDLLVMRADKRLRHARQQGGNRVAWSDEAGAA